MIESLSIAALGLLNDARATARMAERFMERGRPERAKRVLLELLDQPASPWSPWEARGVCLLTYLSLNDSPEESLERLQDFRSKERELPDRLNGLLYYETAKAQTLLDQADAAQSYGLAWACLTRLDDDPKLYWTLGQIAFHMGMDSHAESYYRRSIEARVNEANSRLALAMLSDDPTEQEQLWEGVAHSEAEPALRAEAYCQLAHLRTNSKDQLECYDKAIELGLPPALDWIARVSRVGNLVVLGRREEAESEVEALAAEKILDARLWAIALTNVNRWAEAWENFQKQPALSHGEASLHAHAALNVGDYKLALDLVEQWLAKGNAEYHGAILLMDRGARASQSLGLYAKANDFLERFEELARDKDAVGLLSLKAEQARLTCELDRCAQLCQAAIAQGAVGVDLSYQMTVGEFDKAREAVEALRNGPARECPYESLDAVDAAILAAEEKHQEFLERMPPTLVEVHDPRTLQYYQALLAVSEAAVGRTAPARGRLSKLEETLEGLPSRDLDCLLALKSEALTYLGEPELAIPVLEDLMTRAHPIDVPAYHYGLGQCYAEMGQEKKAQEHFRTAHQSCPQAHSAKLSLERLEG